MQSLAEQLNGETTQEAYDRLVKFAETVEERVQIAVLLNRQAISQRCWQYEKDAFAWRWRSDNW